MLRDECACVVHRSSRNRLEARLSPSSHWVQCAQHTLEEYEWEIIPQGMELELERDVIHGKCILLGSHLMRDLSSRETIELSA